MQSTNFSGQLIINQIQKFVDNKIIETNDKQIKPMNNDELEELSRPG